MKLRALRGKLRFRFVVAALLAALLLLMTFFRKKSLATLHYVSEEIDYSEDELLSIDGIDYDEEFEYIKKILLSVHTNEGQTTTSLLLSTEKRAAMFQTILEDIIIANDPGVTFSDQQRGSAIIPSELSKAGSYRPLSFEWLTKNSVNPLGPQLIALAETHSVVVDAIEAIDASKLYSGDGIVINSGGIDLGTALVLIIQLRSTGSKLPIELVVNSKFDVDDHVCEILASKFNFDCVFIDEELPFFTDKLASLTKFQLKVLGILVSSFENAIVLDSDNFPILNVDELLDSEQFKEAHFLLWPDLWQKSTSPFFYEVVGLVPGEPTKRLSLVNGESFKKYASQDKMEDIGFHDLDGIPSAFTSETGQMVVNKKEHIKPLILSLYYNYYGPDCYYSLIYQGSAGEGDKDTFVPALHVLNESYHLVPKVPQMLGYYAGPNMDGPMVETTLVQYSPSSVNQFMEHWDLWLESRELDPNLWPFQDNEYTHSLYNEFSLYLQDNSANINLEPFFLHIHKPKINPLTNYKNEMDMSSRRNLGKLKEVQKTFGKVDWELRLHSISKWVACEALSSSTIFHKYNLNQLEVCQQISQYVTYLKKTSNSSKTSVFAVNDA